MPISIPEADRGKGAGREKKIVWEIQMRREGGKLQWVTGLFCEQAQPVRRDRKKKQGPFKSVNEGRKDSWRSLWIKMRMRGRQRLTQLLQPVRPGQLDRGTNTPKDRQAQGGCLSSLDSNQGNSTQREPLLGFRTPSWPWVGKAKVRKLSPCFKELAS